jgi:hypothetical protein
MIQDVDESLRALVRRDAVPGNEVEVLLDAPTKDWASRRNTPTLDLYLYDLREDLPGNGPAPSAPVFPPFLFGHGLDPAA